MKTNFFFKLLNLFVAILFVAQIFVVLLLIYITFWLSFNYIDKVKKEKNKANINLKN
jgi:phage shock protein PspC (stress-responsive transcriptional regulator)